MRSRLDETGTFNASLAVGVLPYATDRSGWIIDDVLLRNVEARSPAERILDEPLVIDVGGRPVKTTYSDHCGVRATIAA